MLDIYATGVDDDPSAGASQKFFATVQNKMHWASHGQTVAEFIPLRSIAAGELGRWHEKGKERDDSRCWR